MILLIRAQNQVKLFKDTYIHKWQKHKGKQGNDYHKGKRVVFEGYFQKRHTRETSKVRSWGGAPRD